MYYIVYNDGRICLDILQNQWSPIYDIIAVLNSIQVCNCLNYHCLTGTCVPVYGYALLSLMSPLQKRAHFPFRLRLTLHCRAVAAVRPQPHLPRQQRGGTTLRGEQERVQQKGEGMCREQLGVK